MRLKQIKLAGFKSFVDPTQVPFPAAMTCVVGPNGCGKSNVIDAVRWVLGESSAKNLRGDAMTDVIFNGSTQRKPVSQASVELVFENTQGKLQGSLADRSEISLKRLVTRDAQSHYFLNGTKCRRRDITDIFLGTGLGPRSYAIIEQGMISKLIESRPQELRVFLEEAAGISKYKERRRETETRIKHTRDNLDRLADVREELGKNLDKLKRQAVVAERYKELKASERRYKAELTCLKWLFYHEHLQQAEQILAALELDLAQYQAQGSGDFRILTEYKQQLETAREVVAASQQKYYQLGADISALEQQLLHQRQRKQSLIDDERNLKLSLQHGLEQMAQEQAQLEELQQQLLEQQPDADLCAQQAEELADLVWQSEQQLLEQ
ncbi:MAG: AAA family ATPase, partial [Gammaproteobacteria bacterium]|nr:AAA family ATPase [Gammaproteobacteria bacterium]